MNYSIKIKDLRAYNDIENIIFPKYVSQLINLANQNAQGTRANTVGQLSELFPEFLASGNEITIDNWNTWYMEKYPHAIEKAVDKIYIQIQNLKEAILLIDREMIEKWVEDLVLYKTFIGLYFQKSILAYLADKQNTTYRLAAPEEESIGIDGYIGDTPYSVKPDTYKTMVRLPETIDVKMIYYNKTKDCLNIEIED